jgi:hypothetical protein
MSREKIRELKKIVNAGISATHPPTSDRSSAQDAALQLLSRSIGFGHKRLAVLRLATAVSTGADVLPVQWDYCRKVAADDSRLRVLLAQAEMSMRVAKLPPAP